MPDYLPNTDRDSSKSARESKFTDIVIPAVVFASAVLLGVELLFG
jgi:hypothetical protein